MSDFVKPDSLEQNVRQAAPTTLVGAAIMLFFGFLYLGRPSGEDLFHRAGLVLYHTLRIGGLAFVLVAFILYVGKPVGLILDAALAMPAGAILILCGIIMGLDGGDWLNTLILVVCGATFFPSGWRNALLYMQITGRARKNRQETLDAGIGGH